MSAWQNRIDALHDKRNIANASFIYREVYNPEERQAIIDEMSTQAIDKDITLILMGCYD